MPAFPSVTLTASRWQWPVMVVAPIIGVAVGVGATSLLDMAFGDEASVGVSIERAAWILMVIAGSLSWSRWRQRRKRDRLLESAPPGTLIAAPARSDWSRQPGVLLIGDEGLVFTRDPPGRHVETSLASSQVASIHWKRSSPFVGLLEVQSAAGERYSWRHVTTDVEPVLRHLQQHSTSRVDV